MSIKAVIFDMDGVLIDSESLWQQAEQELFRDVGALITDDLLVETKGLRSGEMVYHWCRRFHIGSETPESLVERYDSRMIEEMRTRVPLMEGAEEAIHFFRDKGLPLGLASNSTMDQIDAAMEKHGLRDYFSLMISASDGMPGKPHPEIYLQAARQLGVEPTECLAVEDSFFGVIAAKAARMKVVALPDPHEYDLERFGAADMKIRSLTEINDTLFEKLQ
ncbi:MAG: hexitol phosphatase HxpB [Bacteroidetes bacterium]|nr:hexitol phosphatase HxpB [Bacteroidota bacterium]